VYRIVLSRAVRRQILDLPGHVRAMTQRQIAQLSQEPRPPGSRELRGHPGYYRLWIGRSHRLVWYVSDEALFVEIHYAGPKPPDLYDRLGLAVPEGE
jgi:mRNA interferase RelE/StbE